MPFLAFVPAIFSSVSSLALCICSPPANSIFCMSFLAVFSSVNLNIFMCLPLSVYLFYPRCLLRPVMFSLSCFRCLSSLPVRICLLTVSICLFLTLFSLLSFPRYLFLAVFGFFLLSSHRCLSDFVPV
eukprot:GILK01016521.1.p1 GENE.GILK01016521.1~~GILK01016521.1.p1  ORF type:complete len:128 (+),score=5.25 GILK01016521.1:215-598(+)